jgi:DNA-binding transcriptional LysR family regulator
MNITINQLQIFLKVCQLNSVTKASEELHLTQPAISIQLRNFQEQFDIPLFEIVGRKIYITDFGKEIALQAESVIQQVDLISFKSSAYKGKVSGRLTISVVSTGKYVMPYFLSGFLKKNNEVNLLMDVTNKQKVVESLESNQVDFALVSILPPKLNVDKIDLLQNKMYLVGNAKSRIKKDASLHDISTELPLIFRENGSGTRQTMERFLQKKKTIISKKLELTSNEAVKQALIAGMGFSIMPLIGIKNELHTQELKIIPLKGLPIKTTWSLIWLKGKRLSPVANAFLAFLKKEKVNIVTEHFNWYENY